MKKPLFLIAVVLAIGFVTCTTKHEDHIDIYYPNESRSAVEAEQESSIIITEQAACIITETILNLPESNISEILNWIPQKSFKRTTPFNATGLGETFTMRGIIVPLINNNNEKDVMFDSRNITLDGSYDYGNDMVFRYNVRTICDKYVSQTWIMVIAGMESSFKKFLKKRQEHFEKYNL